MLWLLMRIRRWTAGGRSSSTLPRVLQDLGNTSNSRGSSHKGFRVVRPPSGGDSNQTSVLLVEPQDSPTQFPLSLTPPHDSPSNSPRPSPRPSSGPSPRFSTLFAYTPPPQSLPPSSPEPQQDSWNSRWGGDDNDGMPTRPPPPIPNYVPQGGRDGNESPSSDHPRTLLSREPNGHPGQSARSSPYMNGDYPTNTDGPIEETH